MQRRLFEIARRRICAPVLPRAHRALGDQHLGDAAGVLAFHLGKVAPLIPITISSLAVMTLNRETLSAAKAGWITTLSMMRVALRRDRAADVWKCAFRNSSLFAPGRPESVPPTETPRELLVARGEKQVRVLLELFRLQLQAAELMQ